MVPLNQTLKTSAEADDDRNNLLTAFFKRVRYGRTKVIANLAGDVIVVNLKNTKRGPVRNPKLPSVCKHPPTSTSKTSPPNPKRMKAPRTNLGVGDASIKRGKAVTDWDEQTGDALDCNGEKRIALSIRKCRQHPLWHIKILPVHRKKQAPCCWNLSWACTFGEERPADFPRRCVCTKGSSQ